MLMIKDQANEQEDNMEESGTVEGRVYFRLSHTLYVLLSVIAVIGIIMRNYYIMGIAAFSLIVLVLVDVHYRKRRYGRLVLPLVQKGKFLYRLRNAYRILWIKHKYLTGFIFANICLVIFIAIDYRRMGWGNLLIIVPLFEFCVLMAIAFARDSERG